MTRRKFLLFSSVFLLLLLAIFAAAPVYGTAGDGTITGFVFQTDGTTPISGLSVSFYDAATGNHVMGTGTDGSGSYTISLPPGTYITNAHGDGWLSEYYNEAGWYDWQSATHIVVTADSTVSGVNFTLEPAGTISGRVTAADGVTPLANMAVGTNQPLGACTDQDGNFRLESVPFNLPVKVWSGGSDNWCGGTTDYLQLWYNNAPDQQSATTLTVTEQQSVIDGVDFALVQGAIITGMIYQSDGVTPITSGVWINADHMPSGNNAGGTQVRPDGSYRLVVPTGTYRVRAGGGGYASEWYDNAGYNGSNATPVSATQGAVTPNINFSLDPAGSISGTVYAADGVTPLVNMNIEAHGYWIGTCSDANGNFTLNDLPLNQPIKVYATPNSWCGGSGLWMQEWYDNAPDEASATPITLTLAQPNRTGVTFTLESAGMVTGTVFQADGTTAIPNISVSFYDAATGNHIMGTGTDQNGYFTISLPPGTYLAEAHGDGWISEYYNETDWQSATHIVVTAGGTVSGVNFTLEPAGMVTGTVYQANGTTPIANVSVSFFDAATNNHIMGTGTDQDGHFTMSLPAGTYIANAHGDGWVSEYYNEAGWQDWQTATHIVVTVGNTVSGVNFTLDPGGEIHGVVYGPNGTTPLANLHVGSVGLGACTNQNGEYTLGSVPLNTPIHVWAGGPDNWCGGAQAFAQEWWNQKTFEYQADAVTLTSVAPVATGINFSLEWVGSISGTVTAAENSAPISGIWVCAINHDANGFNETATFMCDDTDVSGVYSIPVPPYSYRMWLFPEDRLRLFYNQAIRYEDATLVSVSNDQDVTGINFSLPLAGVITGKIYLEDGITPAYHVTVSTADGSYMECTQQDGSYRIFVPAGTHVVRAGAGACDPNVAFPTQYYNGVFAVPSATPITLAAGQTVGNINFVRGDQAFMPPILLTPYGDTPTNTPIFNWSTATGATWYQVWISQLDGMAQIDRWYEASACSGGTCSAGDIPLLSGAYRWWVRAWRADLGYSAWSAPLDFQITAQTATPAQVSPFGLEISLNPTYTWNAVSGASWYYVWVNNESGTVLDHWYAAVDACTGSVCSWTPAETLGGGEHQWWVQAWSPYGGYSAWSAGLSFSVPFQTAPAQTAPAGQLDAPPTALTWADLPGSSWWQVWFSSAHGGGSGYWYDAATICAAGSCSIAPPVAVGDDAYSWWVQAWNPVAGYSLWSAGMTFWLPLSPPTLTAPSGTVTTGDPVFTWTHQDHAEWYLLWVSGGVDVHVFDQWYNASAICSGDTCSIQPITVPNGTYYWWVQAWSPYSGYSAWSADGMFTVEIP